MTIKDFWCPKCENKGLHPYDKDNSRPNNTDDIDHLWCLYCDYRITSGRKKVVKRTKEVKK